MDPFQRATALVVVILNSFSAVGALLVIVAIVGGMLLDKKTMDRVSIRFTLAIAVVDFIKALTSIFAPSRIMDITSCTLLECVSQWTTLFYLFLNMAIAINLHLVFIKGKSFNPMWEKAYWIGTFALATVLSLIPIALLMGGVIIKASCMRRTATQSQYIWQWILYNTWVLGTCAYCSVIFVLIICKLNANERNLSQALGMNAFANKADDWRSLRYNSTIKSLIRRVAMYCVIPVVTQVGYLVFTIAEYHVGKPSKPLFVFAIITIGLPGILNFLAFLGDPAFTKALHVFKMYQETVWRYSRNLNSTDQQTSSCHTQEINTTTKARPRRNSISTPAKGTRDSAFPDLRASLPQNKTLHTSQEIIEIPYDSPDRCDSWISDRPTSIQPSDSQSGDDTPTLLACGIRDQRVSAYMKFL